MSIYVQVKARYMKSKEIFKSLVLLKNMDIHLPLEGLYLVIEGYCMFRV